MASVATAGETEENQERQHQKSGHKSLLQSDALYQVRLFLRIFLLPLLMMMVIAVHIGD